MDGKKKHTLTYMEEDVFEHHHKDCSYPYPIKNKNNLNHIPRGWKITRM